MRYFRHTHVIRSKIEFRKKSPALKPEISHPGIRTTRCGAKSPSRKCNFEFKQLKKVTGYGHPIYIAESYVKAKEQETKGSTIKVRPAAQCLVMKF